MSSNVETKLAAIMFTDIAGYTFQMSKDQDIALSMLDEKRKVLKPLIQKHKGTLIKEMGDGTLSHFSSAIDATNCSLDLQKSLKDNNDLNIRIGVHLGDTSFRDDDIFGDGVNIASRLEKMSPPGGILVSKNVYDELSSRKGYNGISLGLQSMKGVGRLVEVYGLKDEYLNIPIPSDYIDTKIEIHEDKEVPSIAIIPFKNKGKEEDAFYAYGISTDLISDCNSDGHIRLASLNNIEKIENYDNLQADDLAKKLNVRYTAEGTLWKIDNMFQLSVELYDTKDKKVVWSDRWQEKWDNLTSIKGKLSDGLLKTLKIPTNKEIKVASSSVEAYEYYLRASHIYHKSSDIETRNIAIDLLHKSIELDNNLLWAKNELASIYKSISKHDEAMKIWSQIKTEAENIGDNYFISAALNNMGNIYSERNDYTKAIKLYNHSLKIKEKLTDKTGLGIGYASLGVIYIKMGAMKKGLKFLNQAMNTHKKNNNKEGQGMVYHHCGHMDWMLYDYDSALLNYENAIECFSYCENIITSVPLNSSIRSVENNIGVIYRELGNYNKALVTFSKNHNQEKKLKDKSRLIYSSHNLGNTYYYMGDYKQAKKYLEYSLTIQKEIKVKAISLLTTTFLFLTYKRLGVDCNAKEIYPIIKETKIINFSTNYAIYKLIEDEFYLKDAYNQIQKSIDSMKKEYRKKFLSYPIPKAIIEEYNKVFKK